MTVEKALFNNLERSIKRGNTKSALMYLEMIRRRVYVK